MASQITSLTIVYSTVYSGADQRTHQSSASMVFVRGIHRSPVNSPHKRPVTRKMFPFDDVIMRHRNRCRRTVQLAWNCYSLSRRTSYRKNLVPSRSREIRVMAFSISLKFDRRCCRDAEMSNLRALRSLQPPISHLLDFASFGGKTSYRLVNRGTGHSRSCPGTERGWPHIRSDRPWSGLTTKCNDKHGENEFYWYLLDANGVSQPTKVEVFR